MEIYICYIICTRMERISFLSRIREFENFLFEHESVESNEYIFKSRRNKGNKGNFCRYATTDLTDWNGSHRFFEHELIELNESFEYYEYFFILSRLRREISQIVSNPTIFFVKNSCLGKPAELERENLRIFFSNTRSNEYFGTNTNRTNLTNRTN